MIAGAIMKSAQGGGLQTIFAIFLGLMVAAFVGVGVYTFYPSPQRDFNRRIEDLSRREEAIRNSRPPDDLTSSDRDRIQELADERHEIDDAARADREGWGRVTSIILIAFATLGMTISLVRADQLPVISNGLLLGGVFTMIYGVGWIVATDTSVARFVVMTAALAITLALGYARFVRRRTLGATPPANGFAGGEGMAELQQRVRDLEERMSEAASALGQKSDHRRES